MSAESSLPGAEAYCPACNRSFAADTTTCPDDGSKLVRFRAEVDPLIGRVLDARFEVRDRIGRGGMGTVYRAWQRSVEREVAIKVIDPRLGHDRTAAKRFLREARLASRLSQPSIVAVYDFGQTDDEVLYIAMELLRGPTLAAFLAGGERPTVRRSLGIAVQICDALEAAHGQGIVHRDLKPQNIVVLDDPPGRDRIKVLDFGLAKSLVGDATTITRDDALLGTPLYMAPEVINGQPAVPASDLYSLGCIVYELLTGMPPFVEANANAVLARHLGDPPAPLPAAVPAHVRAIVDRLLAKDPGARLTPAEVRAAAQQALAEDGVDVVPVRERERSRAALADTISTSSAAVAPPAPARRLDRRWWWLALVLVAAAGALVWQLTRDPGHAAPAAAPDAAPPPRDAAPPPPDAAPVPAIVVDAEPAPPPPDAAPARTPRPRPTRVTPDASPVPPPDPEKPDVDFLPVPEP